MRRKIGRLVERIRWAGYAWTLASDVRSFVELARLRLCGPTINTVDVRLRALEDHAVAVRPCTADLWAIEALLPPVHLPPEQIARQGVARIWDLGANIGLTMSHLALSCPDAEIVGVELDAENAALCRRNVAPWAARCRVIEAAVWERDGEIVYAGEDGGELGLAVAGDSDSGAEGLRAEALTLNSLLSESDDPVDYVKMDIEGAERHVLRANTQWAERVRSIKVEVHPPYTVQDCQRDLEALGFQTSIDPLYRPEAGGMPPVVGVKPNYEPTA